jgi:hypothetical protein
MIQRDATQRNRCRVARCADRVRLGERRGGLSSIRSCDTRVESDWTIADACAPMRASGWPACGAILAGQHSREIRRRFGAANDERRTGSAMRLIELLRIDPWRAQALHATLDSTDPVPRWIRVAAGLAWSAFSRPVE